MSSNTIKNIWDYLDEQDAAEFSIPEEDKPRYAICDAAQAERVVKYYKSTMREINVLKNSANDWLERAKKKYDSYIENVIVPLQNKAEFFEGQLRNYAENQISNTNKKSVKLVEGTLQFTKTQDKYEHDDDVILDFINGLKENDKLRTYLKPQPAKLDWKTMKDSGVIQEVKLEDGTVENHLFVEGTEIPAVKVQTGLPPAFRIK